MGTRKGITVYAKTDFNCLQCGTILKAGERAPHQTLCSGGRNTTTLSRCQSTWYNKRKINKRKELRFIYCDICHKKQRQLDARQVRCMSAVKGELSECQQIAKTRAIETFRKKKKKEDKNNKRHCLKCGKMFVGNGKYNRVCSTCAVVNSRMPRTSHKVMAY
jgi:hypothetical protein